MMSTNGFPVCVHTYSWPRQIWCQSALKISSGESILKPFSASTKGTGWIASRCLMFAFERSVVRFAAIRLTVGEPNLFQMIYRTAFNEVVATVIELKLTNRKLPNSLIHGQNAIFLNRIKNNFVISPKGNCWFSTTEISRAIPSLNWNFRGGKKVAALKKTFRIQIPN